MKKQILELGKTLNKTEQKKINGGISFCDSNGNCPDGYYCQGYICYRDSSGGNGSGNNNSGNTGDCIPDRFCIDENDTCCIG